MRDGPLLLNESNAMVSYIFAKYTKKADNLFPSDPTELAQALNWQVNDEISEK